MLARLHETSKYSAERQLYTLMYELLQQNSIVATDIKMRIDEIMIGKQKKPLQSFLCFDFDGFLFHFVSDLANPNSVTAKALHILPPLKFEF